MKKYLLTTFKFIIILIAGTSSAFAQFNSDPLQTYYVCNATGTQLGVSAFGDGNGGTYSFWTDKRNGVAGTAIYGQHMDSLGNPLWTTNGKLMYQQNAKEVWLMKAVKWQSGILIGWVQGGFGIGGDSLITQYYNSNGVSQWVQPKLIANKQGNIIYVGFDDMDIYPNDSGATFTFSLTQSGGNSYFSFNRIDFSGNLLWPLNTFTYYGNGYYYHTGYDNHNGFYVAASTGGLGTHIYLGHFDLQGNLTIPTPVDICGTAGGRGNSQWKVLCDADTNAYIVWASSTNYDISISKISPSGVLAWPDAKPICAAASAQENPDAIIKGNTIYAVWDDGRPTNAGNYDIYMQKLDTAGTTAWTTDGILLSHVGSYIPYPKLAPSGNNIVATYLVTGGYRGQLIHPDSTIAWSLNGILVNVNNPPFYGDYQLISAADGSVTAIWKENSDQICAARVRPNGTLTLLSDPGESAFIMSPNPAKDELFISGHSVNNKNISIRIYNVSGKLVYGAVEKSLSGNFTVAVPVKKFSAGIYMVQIGSDDIFETRKIIVEK